MSKNGNQNKIEEKTHNFSNYTNKTGQQICDEFQTSLQQGLSTDQVQERHQRYGYNKLEEHTMVWWEIIKNQFRSPFIFLLIFVAIISFFVADIVNAFIVLACVLVNIGVGFYQEYRAEQSVRLLKSYLLLQVTVRRNGTEMEVPSSELVPGDVLLLVPGDIVSADIRLLNEQNLMIDESPLTGESAPVEKSFEPIALQPSELYKATNMAFSGTTVVSGKGEGIVVFTAADTALGTIAQLTDQEVHESGLATGVGKFSKFILRFIFLTLILLFLANVIIKKGDINFIELLMFTSALAISVVPEALPIVTTICLSQGALRLARQKILVKRLSAIEDLGAIELLCTDKTGTLTENVLTVVAVYGQEQQDIVFWGTVIAPLVKTKETNLKGFDLALWNYLTPETRERAYTYKRIFEIPFNPDIRKNSVVVESDDNHYTLVVRGAMEEVIKGCSLDQAQLLDMQKWVANQGHAGNRVIAIATKTVTQDAINTITADETGLTFCGLIALQDPIKKTSFTAVKKAIAMGITLKVLSGDGPEVSGSVAYHLGLIDDPSKVMTGAQWSALSAAEKARVAEHYHVFARFAPQQKFELVNILQQSRSIGFLGDGINDAPALKTADVGLAVPTASDVAKEAADIILLQKSLHVIVDGVQEGRKVFTNTIKYIRTTLASNFGNFYALAISSLFVDFLPMLPMHLLMVNLLTDFPLIAIATDSVDKQELARPKKYEVKDVLLVAVLLGMVSTIFDFIYFALFYKISPQVLQTSWFLGSVLTELVFIYSIRTKLPFFKARRPSLTLSVLSVVAATIAFLLVTTAWGQHWFSFAHLSSDELMAIISVAGCYFIITELVKLIFYHFYRSNGAPDQK